MKTFFSMTDPRTTVADRDPWSYPSVVGRSYPSAQATCAARIAEYDGPGAAPRVEDVACGSPAELIDALSARAYSIARERGGRIPYTAVREVTENLIHASFSEVVVTVAQDGNTLRFSDQGPGIADKARAFLPGFSTASREMKGVIRGVGSGLPIVKDCLSFAGGEVVVDDNLGGGTVVTLSVAVGAEPVATESRSGATEDAPAAKVDDAAAQDLVSRLSTRQKQVLSLVMELGAAGPTAVAKELAVGLSTAYRDLAYLEALGLIASDETGKRVLSPSGAACLDGMFR